MLIFIAFVLGCALGWYRAVLSGGGITDRIQYALAHGIPIGLLALAGVVLYARLSVVP